MVNYWGVLLGWISFVCIDWYLFQRLIFGEIYMDYNVAIFLVYTRPLICLNDWRGGEGSEWSRCLDPLLACKTVFYMYGWKRQTRGNKPEIYTIRQYKIPDISLIKIASPPPKLWKCMTELAQEVHNLIYNIM